MATNVDDPTLPVGCEDATAPDVLFDECTPELNSGYLREMLVTHAPFVATPTAAVIATREALAATDPLAIRRFKVEASLGAPTDKSVRYDGVDYPIPGDNEIPVTIKETNQKNYEFARTTQKGYKAYFYFIDMAGTYWYGGQNGIGEGNAVLKLSPVIGAGEDDLMTITGSVKYKGLFSPKRIPNPA